MNVSDYIVQYIAAKGTTCAFGYPGGMVTYLMDSFDKHSNISAYAMYHEQAAAFAACGYSQATGNVGVAYATSGPGATNLITGICHAFFESVPTLFITGQVNTNESKGSLKVRQKGFQETNIINMVSDVTKYCAYVQDAADIRYYLDKAFYYAKEGRPGPVLLDIPIDIQRTEVQVETLRKYEPEEEILKPYKEIMKTLENSLIQSKKPVIILGNGVNGAGIKEEIIKVLEKLKIPVVSSMISIDLLPSSSSINFGFIGAYGHRHANFIISQSDLIISLGSRLDIRQTGASIDEFGKNAKLIRIDIDSNEFDNRIKSDEIDVCVDLKHLIKYLDVDNAFSGFKVEDKWINKCQYYKMRLSNLDQLEPNKVVNYISRLIPDESIITTDVGQNQVWVAQSFDVKQNQRVLFSGGHGAMGYSLPAAIGAYFGNKKPVYCFVGDGGFQMNIQELQFLVRENIPIKIFVLNNHSLGMIRHFQEMYFESNNTQTIENKGYSVPSFTNIATAYGIKNYLINDIEDVYNIKDNLYDQYPLVIDINVGDTTYVYPKLAFGKPIYDQEPEIPRNVLNEILQFEGESDI